MILLTGATGTIGRATMTALRTASAAFKVAARNPADLHAQGVPSLAFDWDKLGSYLPALQVPGRPPRSMREWGVRLRTAPGTA